MASAREGRGRRAAGADHPCLPARAAGAGFWSIVLALILAAAARVVPASAAEARIPRKPARGKGDANARPCPSSPRPPAKAPSTSISTRSARSRRATWCRAQPRRRTTDERRLPRRSGGQGGRPARADRSAPVRGDADPSQRADGARPGAAEERARSTSSATERCSRRTRSRSSRSTRRKRWSGNIRAPSRPIRAQSTTPSCSSPTRESPRRSAAASACGRSIPATSCMHRTRTAWSRSRKSSR